MTSEAALSGRAWQVLLGPQDGHVTRQVPRRRQGRRVLARELRALPAGTAVVLVADRAGGRWATRRLAHTAGVQVDRELVGLPGARDPLAVTDDVPSAGHLLVHDLAAVPPGAGRRRLLMQLALAVARCTPWPLLAAALPGRVLLGTRR